MRRKKSMKYALATIAMILTLWLTSCTSTQKNKPLPRYTPPDPYDAEGNLIWQYDPEKESVTVPYWYWEMIIDYFIDTQEALKAQGEKGK